MAAFATDRALVTVHWPDGFDIDAVVARWDSADLPLDGVGPLLHGVLDMVADGHLDAVRALDEELDTLEAALFDDQSVDRDLFRRAARLRRSLSELRRITQPMREILSALMNHELDDRLRPYFHDIQDHVVHAAQWADSLREVTSSLRESHLNLQNNQLNSVMKKVTAWAAIIAVPTAITGFYGQNLPYPGAEQPWGFWVSTAAICTLSVALSVFQPVCVAGPTVRWRWARPGGGCSGVPIWGGGDCPLWIGRGGCGGWGS